MPRPRGLPKTGGRKKGSKNKRTAERQKAMTELAEKIAGELGIELFGGDAHALLQLIYRNRRADLEMRVYCAAAALPYEKPRLAVVEHSGRDGGPIAVVSAEPDPAEAERWAQQHAPKGSTSS